MYIFVGLVMFKTHLSIFVCFSCQPKIEHFISGISGFVSHDWFQLTTDEENLRHPRKVFRLNFCHNENRSSSLSEICGNFWEFRQRWTHVVALPQGICHCLGLCHLHHHLVEPVEVIISVILVNILSHTQELGLACLDVWTLATLFCLNYFAASVGYKYLFLLHENNQLWESGKQSPIQLHGPALFYRKNCTPFRYVLSRICKTKFSSLRKAPFQYGTHVNPF